MYISTKSKTHPVFEINGTKEVKFLLQESVCILVSTGLKIFVIAFFERSHSFAV